MKKFIFLFISLVCLFPAISDTRTENIDVYVILDKSLSMEDKIFEVKKYVKESIVDKVLISGDTFKLITFYGKAEYNFGSELNETTTKADISNLISQINADGRFTDIGNALDKLISITNEAEISNRRKYLLLITDGIQEAPPESKYYHQSSDFNHELLTNTKTIQKEGWKIEILGIGQDSAAEKIANELSAGYSETSDSPKAEELAEITENLISNITLTQEPTLSKINILNKAKITLTMEANNYEENAEVVISNIFFRDEDLKTSSVIESPISINLINEKITDIEIPVVFNNIKPGKYSGDIYFTFDSIESFQPAIFTVNLKIKNLFEKYWYLFLLLILALIYLVNKIVKNLKTKPLAFKILSQNIDLDKINYTLAKGEKLFLVNTIKGLNIVKSSTSINNAIGSIIKMKNNLKFSLINNSGIKIINGHQGNLIGKSLKIVLKNGKDFLLKFEKK